MKKVLLLLIFVILATACAPNYSGGTRVGVVTKLSEKGLIWKSWEGEMLMALPIDVAGNTQPEKFEFNVALVAVLKVQEAMNSGQRVELLYREWFFPPFSIDNGHVVTDVRFIKRSQ